MDEAACRRASYFHISLSLSLSHMQTSTPLWTYKVKTFGVGALKHGLILSRKSKLKDTVISSAMIKVTEEGEGVTEEEDRDVHRN